MSSVLYQVLSGLCGALVFVVWVKPEIFRSLRDKDSDYPSLGRQGQFTALIVSTWVLVTSALSADGKVPEFMYVGFMVAWAGAGFTSVWLKLKGQSVGAVTETKATATVVSTSTPAPTSPEKKDQL